MKQLKLEKKSRNIILAVIAAIVVIVIMVFAAGSTSKKKVSKESGLDLVRAGNTNISKDEARKQRLVVAVDTIDGILNPVITTASGDLAACRLIFEPLARKLTDGSYENVLAESVTWNKESLTMTIKLKPGIVFSDGSALTANDVCASIGAFCLASYNLDTDGAYFNIKGAWDMNEQKSTGIEGIRKVDDLTVEVTFMEALAENWEILETQIQKNTFADIEETFNGFFAEENLMKSALGTGAYAVESIAPGITIVLTANGSYREAIQDIKKVELSKINFYDMQKTLDAQNVDVVAYSANSEQFEMLYSAGKYDVYTRPENDLYALGFNMNNIFLKQQKVRQAISYALNRNEIIGKDWQSRFEECNTIGYGTTEEAKFEENAISYDKSKAVALLEEDNMKDRMTLRLPVQKENAFQMDAAAVIKKNLEAVGIGVEIKECTDDEYVQALYIADDFDLYLFLTPIAYDAESLYSFTTLRNGMPVACTSETFTEAIKAMDAAADQEEYQTALKTAATEFYDLVPAVPLARAKRYLSVSADLSGFATEAGVSMVTKVNEIISKAK